MCTKPISNRIKSRPKHFGVGFFNEKTFFEKPMKQVTIQGIAGCFHETAARKFFGAEPISVVPCESFETLFSTLDSDRSLLGIAAIENTVAPKFVEMNKVAFDLGFHA